MVQGNSTLSENQTFNAMENSSIELPDNSAFADMEMSREGQDLVLESSNGQNIIIENYFSAEPAPILESADGSVLTPELVEAFVQSPEQLAQIETAAGAEPVGAIEELHGEATVTRADGSSEPVTLGTPIYQGDIVETSADGGVNILFVDETSMAISEGARFAVKDYSFDAETESGTTNFSVLRGVFVFTSGLIGRDDPDDVTIDTPVGSIGIRGTIIAGNINPEGESSISVVEGAIVVKNGTGERTLSEQFETIHINGFNAEMQDMGVLEPAAVTQAYGSASYVVPALFSNLNDAAKEKAAAEEQQAQEEALEAEALEETKEEVIEEPVKELVPEMMQEPIDQPLEFQLMHETDSTEIKKTQRHQMKMEEQQQQEKEPIDELQNPDVIASAQIPEFTITNRLTENEQSGGVAARLVSVQSDTRFVFGNGTTTSADGHFEIIGNNVVLTAAGHSALNGLIAGMGSTGFDDTISWGNYAIQAIGPDNQTVTHGFNPLIKDIGMNLYGGGQGPLEGGRINLGEVDHAINGGKHDDLAYINGSGDVVINSGLDLANLRTTTGGGYTSLAGIGDWDNDGYADIIAGRSGHAGGGAIDTINGGATISAVPNISQATGVLPGDNYGHSVSGAGDFNGDGGLDYIVGATGANGGNGEVYLHYAGGGDITFGAAGGYTELGHFVAGVGDVTDGSSDGRSDGLSDILIGGRMESTAYLVYGGSGSIADVTAGGGNITAIDVTSYGAIITGSAAGDFNGDGYDDFVVATTNGTDVKNFVVFGGDTLQTTITMADLENPDHAFKINDINGFDSNYTVRSVGDLNGDGFDDIEVGSMATGFHIIHGGLHGNAPYAADGAQNDDNDMSGNLWASANDQALVNSRNYYDQNYDNLSITGNSQNNNITITDETFRAIHGGTGGDTIRYGVGAGSLDFTNIEYEQVSGVERIQYSQDGATIQLTVENIFNLLKSSDHGVFKIELDDLNGVTSGLLNIDAPTNTWTDDYAGIEASLEELTGVDVTHADYNGTHEQFNIGGYTLYIDHDVTVATV